MSKANKELAVKQDERSLSLAKGFSDGGWEGEAIDSTDIIIPKILLMHPTSDLVKKGERNQGELIKSTDNEVVAPRKETFSIVVFEKFKEWRIMEKNPQTQVYEYVGMAPWTPTNDSLPWDYTEGGKTFRRDKVLNFYGLLTKEIDSGKAFPVKISFTRTAYKAGMKIADAYAKSLMERQPPTRQTFKIGSELVQADQSYFAFTVAYGEASTEKQMEESLKWKKIIKSARENNSVRDHDVDNDATISDTGSTEQF